MKVIVSDMRLNGLPEIEVEHLPMKGDTIKYRTTSEHLILHVEFRSFDLQSDEIIIHCH